MEPTSPLAGQRVAITGPLTGPLRGLRRGAALRMVAEMGGIGSPTVNRRTTLLVASRRDTAKARRAKALGLQVLTPAEFASLIGYPALF